MGHLTPIVISESKEKWPSGLVVLGKPLYQKVEDIWVYILTIEGEYR